MGTCCFVDVFVDVGGCGVCERSADVFLTRSSSQLSAAFPTHPLVADYQQKADLFDELADKFTVPPLAAASA